MNEPIDIDALVDSIKNLKKYRETDICEDTIRDLLETELKHHKKVKDAVKATRKKLHEVVAPYLGDPDYEQAKLDLAQAFQSGDLAQIKATCADIMRVHDTTRERLDILDTFYQRIFEVTGTPTTLLDVACGLNPLSYPWMNLPEVRLYAYDIHQQRVEFLNQYFRLQNITGEARIQDVLVNFPQEKGEVALLLKEMHRFERRQHGCSLPLLEALPVRYVVVSLPTRNLSGRHDLSEGHRNMLYNVLKGRAWPVTEIEFSNELVFCIDKGVE